MNKPRDEVEESIEPSDFYKARYKTLFDSAPGAIIVTDIDGNIIEANISTLTLFGYSLNEIKSLKAMDLYAVKNDRSLIIDIISKNGMVRNHEVTLQKRDGTKFLALVNEDFVNIGDQKLIFAIIRDVTEQRRAEEKVREERDKATLYLNTAAVIFVALDTDGKITMLNKVGCKLLGVEQEDVIGTSWFHEFLPGRIRNEVGLLFTRMISGELNPPESYENPIINRNGEERLIRWRTEMLKNEDGTVIGVLSSGEDITSIKIAQDALEESEEQYRRTLNSIGDAVHVVDRDLKIILVNNALFRWLSSIPIDNEVYGRKVMDAFPFLPASTRNDYDQVFETGEPIVKHERTSLAGQEYHTDVRLIPIIKEGTVVQVVSVIRNVTQEHRAQEQVKTAAETSMLYLDLLGHDIRNHLQGLIIGVEFLRHLELGPEASTMMEFMLDVISRAKALIAKVHATPDLLTEPLSKVSLTSAILDSISLMTDKYPDVIFDLDMSVKSAYVRAGQYLTYLFMNLLENAIVHNSRRERKVWVSLKESSNGYDLTISDNGNGLPDDRKEALFNPNRRFGGIGVHQVKRIAERYGAKLEVRDRVVDDHTQGVEFEVWLPSL